MTGVCRVCGCTDDNCTACINRTGVACYWFEPDLCSACVPAFQERLRRGLVRAAALNRAERDLQGSFQRKEIIS
jgi:hypothetical protein